MTDNFHKIALRIAGRSDVLNQVDAVFNALNVYPPALVEISSDIYEGEIDTGWILKVIENKSGVQVFLNGKPTSSLEEAAKAFKSKDSRYDKSLSKSSAPFEGSHEYAEWFRLNEARVDPDGLFYADVEWTVTDNQNVKHNLSAKVKFELVPDYDSEKAERISETIDGKSVKDILAFDLDVSDESFIHPETVADQSIQEALENKLGDKFDGLIEAMRQGDFKALYDALGDGKIV